MTKFKKLLCKKCGMPFYVELNYKGPLLCTYCERNKEIKK